MDDFKILTFSVSRKNRSVLACIYCKKRHRKCIQDIDQPSCNLCIKANVKCIWGSPKKHRVNKGRKKEISLEKEQIFQQLYLDGNNSNQFVCSTQPLTPLLSKDSILCFDGSIFGLFYPWRGPGNGNLLQKDNVDKDLIRYLDSKGAFFVPPFSEQTKLLEIFMDKLYRFYPILERNMITNIKTIPLLLLNAIMLVSIKFDPKIDKHSIRQRANEYFEKCKLLIHIEKKKVTLIQSYLLLSYHEEGTNGPNCSKEFLSKACNLCGELAITHMYGTNGMNTNTANHENRILEGTSYSKSFLLRLFWVSFCCDRLISTMNGREMYYNTYDMMIDEPTIEDFDGSNTQVLDYETFSTYLSMCRLLERVNYNCFRSSKNRTKDNNLEKDLINWSTNYSIHCGKELQNFFQIAHAFICILYFRYKVVPDLTIIQELNSNSDEVSTLIRYPYIDNFLKQIIESIESASYVHHIIIIHAVINAFELSQAQIKIGGLNNIEFYRDIAKRSIRIMDKEKYFWWVSNAAFHICKEKML